MEVFIHPLCYSSYILVKELHKNGFMDEVRLVDVSQALSDVLRYGVLSVPWVVLDGVSVATDPLEP